MDVGSISRVVNAMMRGKSRISAILDVGMMDPLAPALDVVGIAAPDATADGANDNEEDALRMLPLLLMAIILLVYCCPPPPTPPRCRIGVK